MDIDTLELQIGSQLPDDYRRYLSEGTFSLESTHWFQITERTPFGEQGGINQLFTLEDFEDDGVNGFPDEQMLFIGSSLFGYPTCICLDEKRYGHIFYYDFEERSLWEKEDFESRFPNLSGSIAQYVNDRDSGLLPPKEPGLESFYHAADSFSEFVAKLVPETYEDEE